MSQLFSESQLSNNTSHNDQTMIYFKFTKAYLPDERGFGFGALGVGCLITPVKDVDWLVLKYDTNCIFYTIPTKIVSSV